MVLSYWFQNVIKVDVPDSMYDCKWMPICEGCTIGVNVRQKPKEHVLKRGHTTCSNFVNHSRRNSRHNWWRLV